MNKTSILPADTYTVINKSILSNSDRKILTMLYQPIIGYTSISLYFTLWADLDTKEIMSLEFTHHHLISNMKLTINNIIEAREQLEAIGLIKTFLKKGDINTYVYELYSPLSANDFFNHPILNVCLYSNIGKIEYDKIIKYFTIPKINLSEYEDITASFSDIFVSIPSNLTYASKDNIIKTTKQAIDIKSSIDFNLIISSIPMNIINEKTFNNDMKDLINKLSYIYNIDSLNMQSIIRNALTEKGLINKELLRKLCRNYYQFEESGNLPTFVYRKQPEYLKQPIGDTSKKTKMIYTFEKTTPYDFLKNKYNNAEPTIRDLKLLEMLMIDQQLQPGVVNVLIDYVLMINNNKLNKAFVETIAGQWKRLNIETVTEAMNVAEKEHRKYKNKINRPIKINKGNDIVPEWFDKDIEIKKPTIKEQEELENILKDFSE